MSTLFSKAVWLEAPSCPDKTSPLFQKEFSLSALPDKAELFISGVGFYHATLNGVPVTDQLLNPAFTAYDKRVYYNRFEVSSLLKEGTNVLQVLLGNGWFNQSEHDSWNFDTAPWRAKPQMICELQTEGETLLVSDPSWQWRKSQITYNSLRSGETFRACDEASPLQSVFVAHGPGGELLPFPGTPIRLRETLDGIPVTPSPHRLLLDFRRSLAGNVEICVRGPKGARVRIRYVERIRFDGTIDREQIKSCFHGGRFQEDEYDLSGEGEERWHSLFGYNGFRYAAIDAPKEVEILWVRARNFHTDLPTTGSFVCDDPLLNRLQSAVVRSTLTNYHHMPTDCPHREKNGWTGDACLSCEETLFNFDAVAAHRKWLDDIVDSQRPNGAIACIVPPTSWGYDWGTGTTWDFVLFELPWQLYLFTGEKSVLERYALPMKKYLGFMQKNATNGIWKNGLGDWCPPPHTAKCPTDALLTAYARQCALLYQKTSEALGNTEEAAWAKALAEEIRGDFLRAFAHCDNESLCFLAMLLAFDLCEDKAAVLTRLEAALKKADYHPEFGIFGNKLIYNTLTDLGRFDLAMKLVKAQGYPGFSYMLDFCGGTLGELWEGGASQNHHMFASVGDFFYKSIAGIRLDEKAPGFRRLTLCPHVPEGMDFFCAKKITPHGLLQVEYHRGTLTVLLPEGTSATLRFGGKTYELSAGKTQVEE